MTDIDLDALRRATEAAIAPGEFDERQDFKKAITPATVLELLDQIELLQAVADEAEGIAPYLQDSDCMVPNGRVFDLDTALEALHAATKGTK